MFIHILVISLGGGQPNKIHMSARNSVTPHLGWIIGGTWRIYSSRNFFIAHINEINLCIFFLIFEICPRVSEICKNCWWTMWLGYWVLFCQSNCVLSVQKLRNCIFFCLLLLPRISWFSWTRIKMFSWLLSQTMIYSITFLSQNSWKLLAVIMENKHIYFPNFPFLEIESKVRAVIHENRKTWICIDWCLYALVIPWIHAIHGSPETFMKLVHEVQLQYFILEKISWKFINPCKIHVSKNSWVTNH